MGLYDEVVCDFPLPDAEMQGNVFQTKDMGCLMMDYHITREGRLLRLEADKVLVKDPEGFLGVRIESTNERWVDTEYHGDLIFYDFDQSGVFVEYLVRFTEGSVVWVKRLPQD